MNGSNQNQDIFPEQPPKRSDMLNVLTILTIIGCCLSYVGTLYNATQWSNYDKQLEQMEEQREKVGSTGFAARMIDDSIELFKKSYEHRYILLISGLLFTTMCLVGAIKMRKLQKSGYPMYVIGELAPIVLSGILLGFTSMAQISIAVMAFVAVVFVVLYTTQRKNLVY